MRNNCIITFEGLNVNSLINSLCRQNITIWGVSKIGKQCVLQVDATHSQKVVAQLKEKCYNIIDIRYTGVSFVTRFAKAHLILVLCLLLCVIALAVSSGFCLRIETQGDFAPELVLGALQQAGVKVGMPFSEFDVDVAENSVATNLKAMYAVINRKGSVIYVNVVATKLIDEPIDMSRRRDIISSVSGVVTATLCEQGNLLVKVGDKVSAGDILIEGRRVFNDGTSNEIYALGKVTVQQSVQGSVSFDGYKTVTQTTGNVCKNVGVVLFGKEYVNTCKYDSYEKETTYKYLPPLNIAIAYNTYYETRQVTIGCDINECMDFLREQAYSEAMSNCNFIPVKVEYSLSGNTMTATLYTTIDIY